MKSKIFFIFLFVNFFIPVVVSASCTSWSCGGTCVGVDVPVCFEDLPPHFTESVPYGEGFKQWCHHNIDNFGYHDYFGDSDICSPLRYVSGQNRYMFVITGDYYIATYCDGSWVRTNHATLFTEPVPETIFRGTPAFCYADGSCAAGVSCTYYPYCLKKKYTFDVSGTIVNDALDCSQSGAASYIKSRYYHANVYMYITDGWGDFCTCGSAGSLQRKCQVSLGSPPDCSCSCPDGAVYQSGACVYSDPNIVFSYVVCKGCNLSETFNVDWRTWYPMPKLPDIPLSVVRYGIPSGTNYDRYEWYCSITGGYKLLTGVPVDVGYADMLQALVSNGCKSRLEKGATLYDAFIYAFKTPSCGDPAYQLWSSDSGSVGVAGGVGGKGFGQSLIKGMKKQGQTFGGGGGCEKRD